MTTTIYDGLITKDILGPEFELSGDKLKTRLGAGMIKDANGLPSIDPAFFAANTPPPAASPVAIANTGSVVLSGNGTSAPLAATVVSIPTGVAVPAAQLSGIVPAANLPPTTVSNFVTQPTATNPNKLLTTTVNGVPATPVIIDTDVTSTSIGAQSRSTTVLASILDWTKFPILPVPGYTITAGDLIIPADGVYTIEIQLHLYHLALVAPGDVASLRAIIQNPIGPATSQFVRDSTTQSKHGIYLGISTTRKMLAGTKYSLEILGSNSLLVPMFDALNYLAITRIS